LLDYSTDRAARAVNDSQGKKKPLVRNADRVSAPVQEESNNLLRRPVMGKSKDKGKKEVKKPKKGK
jgi:hypothetical protein